MNIADAGIVFISFSKMGVSMVYVLNVLYYICTFRMPYAERYSLYAVWKFEYFKGRYGGCENET